MLENEVQRNVIKEIKARLPEALIMKNDPNYIQGIPDLTILYKNKWATLEVKASPTSSKRPNQRYYVDRMNKMSFSSFINPDNMEEVLNDMERSFKTGS